MTLSSAFARALAPELPRAFALLVLLTGALTAVLARAHDADRAVDAHTLLTAFARMPGLEAKFREEKQLALLAKPLTSEGTLYFAHPDLLLRRVERPSRSEVLIAHDTLRVRDQAGEQALDLRARKDLRPFIESLTWILAGNEAALRKLYAVEFVPAGPAAPWQLVLKPKAEPLSRLIAELRIQGRGLRVSQIEVRETNGDKTLTHILEANPERKFSAKERETLFGSGARAQGRAEPSRTSP
jgi:outer membrane lipoprotein-sorting protein